MFKIEIDQEKREAAKAARNEKFAAHMARINEKQAARKRRSATRAGSDTELAGYREAHPLEVKVSKQAAMTFWPQPKYGEIDGHSIAGAHAELFNADAHKAWTGSRLAGNAIGVASLGTVPTFSGRKNKGSAVINILFPDGDAMSVDVVPDKLAKASRYVHAFNVYAEQLAAEAADE